MWQIQTRKNNCIRRAFILKEQEIFNRVSIVNVKNKLELQEIYSLGDIIYVRCPFCFSTKGDMKLNTSNNSYICKNCEESGYAIGLYAKYKHINNKEAYKELIRDKADISNDKKSSITINTKKSDDELDEVYQSFLQMLTLSSEHTMKLLKLGFTIEDIEKLGFKTIPTNEQNKIKICRKLIEKGIELDRTPGFFQDQKFRWNFVSHKGILVPVINNCKIVSLRIHLDNTYNTDTTDIWFSSSSKQYGTKTNNNIMIILPEKNRLQLMNNNKEEKDIIVASEMLLAYKIHSQYKDRIVIRDT